MSFCCVIGLGYIGLPTSLILSKSGHRVVGVDINENIVENINKGKLHLKEPKLGDLLLSEIKKGNFSASTKIVEADIFIIAVPTPFYSSDNTIPKPNLEFINKAILSIIPFIRKGNLVIIESTSPVTTTKEISNKVFANTIFTESEIYFAYCPERVLPGNILYELVNNDRVVGGINEKSTDLAFDFYSTFCKGKIHKTNAKTAELVKLSENAYRDLNIAFANELSMIASKYDIEINELISIANKHPRVNILNPGCGVGGHCIAVDPWFIASSMPKDTPLIQLARKVNQKKVFWTINIIESKIKNISLKKGRKIKIGIFGLSYKPNIDDLRESPALEIALELKNKGYLIYSCEPNISKHDLIEIFNAEYVLNEVDLSVFLVLHDEFKKLNLTNYEILDFCGMDN